MRVINCGIKIKIIETYRNIVDLKSLIMKTQVAWFRNTIASLVAIAMAVNRVYSSDKTCLSYNNWRPVQGNKSWAYTRTSEEIDGALNCV